MGYASALNSPHRFQFETNSGSLEYSQKYNCGPTCVAKIAQFYRDTWYGIEANRKLIGGMGPYNVNNVIVYGAPAGMPTSAWQQRDMLGKRGVPATTRSIDSLDQLHGLVDTGRRPLIIGVMMGLVPAVYRDHNFTGWHAVCVMAGGWINGTRGVWINDPNFSPPGGFRLDPDRGRKWYPDWVIQNAFINNSPRWSVVPNSLKGVVSGNKGRGRIAGPGCNIRTSPVIGATNILARSHTDGWTYRLSDGKKLWTNDSQFIFLGWDSSGTWARVQTGAGQNLFIAKSVFVVTVWP